MSAIVEQINKIEDKVLGRVGDGSRAAGIV